MSGALLIDNPAPHVRQLTLNRPDQLNALTTGLCGALHVELRAIAAERSCRAGDWLASRAGSYLTGTVIPLDGGITGCN